MIEHDPIDYSQHEEYLPEHVHEWHFFEESKDGCFCVKGCSSRLSRDKAEDMLNEYETLKAATKRLSAKVARRNGVILRLDADKLSYGAQTQGYSDSVDLIAYANILEGK